MQANQKPVIWSVVVATVLILVLGMFATMSINSNLKSLVDDIDDFDIDEAALANAIVAGIVIPEIDNEKLDRVCELTDGCEFYEYDFMDEPETWINLWNEWVTSWTGMGDVNEDFDEEVIEILEDTLEDELDIDKEDFSIVLSTLNAESLKGYQVRAYTEDEFDDENWEVKLFIRQEYTVTGYSIDDDDQDGYIYLLVTSVLDEGEYDSMTVEEVDRHFEFN